MQQFAATLPSVKEAEISCVTLSRFETEIIGIQHSAAEVMRRTFEAHGTQSLNNGELAAVSGVALRLSKSK